MRPLLFTVIRNWCHEGIGITPRTHLHMLPTQLYAYHYLLALFSHPVQTSSLTAQLAWAAFPRSTRQLA